MKKEKKIRIKPRVFEIYTVLLLLSTLFMGIAFANITDIELQITGDLMAPVQRGVFISDVSMLSINGVVSQEIKYYRQTALSTSIELSKTSTSSVTYAITLYNNSSTDYYFTGVSYVEEGYDNKKITYDLEATSNSYITLEPYTTIISPKETIKANLTFKYPAGTTVSTSQVLNSLLNLDFNNEFIEFKIGTTKYKAPKGANWEQYINSEYNTMGLNIKEDKVYTSANKKLLYTDSSKEDVIGQEIKITDEISKDYLYVQEPTLTLDKETLELQLANGTATNTLTVTSDNKDLELKWEVEPTDSGITLSGTGTTRTITATKPVENAVITVSYGVAKVNCKVTVKELLPQIGDKVVYDEGTGLTSTVDTTFPMQDMEWRILDIEDDGTIELISTQPTGNSLTLTGENGYLYGPDNIDKICDDLYGQGIVAASARNLKVEDIDKLAGITTDEDKKTLHSKYGTRWQYRYSTSDKLLQYRKSTNGTTWGNWTNVEGEDKYQTFKEPGKEIISSSNTTRIAEVTHNLYTYTISNYVEIETFDGISMVNLIAQGLNNLNNAASGTFFTQFLSSNGYCDYSSHHGGFFIRRIAFNTSIGESQVSYTDLFGSSGDSYSRSGNLRPVVVLKNDVKLTRDGDTWRIERGNYNEITFKINGINYTAEEGMTWSEWIKSSYNTVGVYENGNVCINVNGKTRYIWNASTYVMPRDKITAGYNYIITAPIS